MFGQSFLIRKGLTKGLEALGVNKNVAKWIGWGVAGTVMLVTLDVPSGAAEGAAAAAGEVVAASAVDGATSVA